MSRLSFGWWVLNFNRSWVTFQGNLDRSSCQMFELFQPAYLYFVSGPLSLELSASRYLNHRGSSRDQTALLTDGRKSLISISSLLNIEPLRSTSYVTVVANTIFKMQLHRPHDAGPSYRVQQKYMTFNHSWPSYRNIEFNHAFLDVLGYLTVDPNFTKAGHCATSYCY